MYRIVSQESFLGDTLACTHYDELYEAKAAFIELGFSGDKYFIEKYCRWCDTWWANGYHYDSICTCYPKEKVMRDKPSRRNSSTTTVYIPDRSYDRVRGVAMVMGLWVKSGYSKKANMYTLHVKGPKNKVAYIRGYVDGMHDKE